MTLKTFSRPVLGAMVMVVAVGACSGSKLDDLSVGQCVDMTAFDIDPAPCDGDNPRVTAIGDPDMIECPGLFDQIWVDEEVAVCLGK